MGYKFFNDIIYIYKHENMFILGLHLYTFVFGSFSGKNQCRIHFGTFTSGYRHSGTSKRNPTKLGPQSAKNIYDDPKRRCRKIHCQFVSYLHIYLLTYLLTCILIYLNICACDISVKHHIWIHNQNNSIS